MLVMVLLFIAFSWIDLSTALIRLFLLVLILLLMPTLNFLPVWLSMSLFFFQAEDGIRDYKVTGVQTCALPILHLRSVPAGQGDRPDRRGGIEAAHGNRFDAGGTGRSPPPRHAARD